MKAIILFIVIVLRCWSLTIAQNSFSLQFDGTNDFVDCGIPSGYVFNDMTAMCWLKTTATPMTYKALVTKDCDGYGSDFSLLTNYAVTGDIAFTGEGELAKESSLKEFY
ncbi:MAG: hypothetical protein ABIQ11_00285 [Saprospiraceae bacterium]